MNFVLFMMHFVNLFLFHADLYLRQMTLLADKLIVAIDDARVEVKKMIMDAFQLGQLLNRSLLACTGQVLRLNNLIESHVDV